MFNWLLHLMERHIRRKAEDDTMREYDVSREYLQAVIANWEALMDDKIAMAQWRSRAMAIAYRYPKDSGIGDILREQEFAERKE